MTAPAARTKLGIAPHFRDRLAEAPAAPLVGTQDTSTLPLPTFLVQEDFQGDPGRAGRLLVDQLSPRMGIGPQISAMRAEFRFGQNRNLPEIIEIRNVGRVQAGLLPLIAVIRHS